MQTYLKSRPAWIQLLLFIGLAAASLLIVMGAGGFIMSAITGIPFSQMGTVGKTPLSDTALLNLRALLVFQFLGLYVLPVLLFVKWSDPQPARYLNLRGPWRSSYWIIGVVILFVAAPLVQYTGVLNRMIPFSAAQVEKIRSMEETATRTIQALVERRDLGNLFLNIVCIALFAGVGEELLFRGVLQRLLIRAFRSPWAGILITAAAFSFFHFQFYGFIPRFILGALLGALYWYSGSMWVAMLAHFLFDALQLVAAWFMPEMINSDELVKLSTTAMLPAALVSLGLLVWLIWIMKRYSQTRFDVIYADELQPPSPDNELQF